MTDEQDWKKQTIADLDKLLGEFQASDIARVQKLNVVWNTMNAVLRALMVKGLISERDIADAGVELMEEAKANLEKARRSEKGFAPTPLERLTGLK